MLDVYIGELTTTDKFNYDKGDWNGNIPKRISSIFPFGSEISKLARSKKIEGKQTDWGAYVLKVNKKQVIELFEEMVDSRKELIELVNNQEQYKGLDVYGIESMRKELELLDDNVVYALACVES